jgi:Ydr279p protein family (RNase H2 complex component) wHTH domain/Ydr279p protein triple barrel domain
MAPRTRSTTTSPVKKAPSQLATTAAVQAREPRNILLLPTNTTPEARLILLPHPRDGSRQRFLFCPSKGLFEFTRIAAPASEYRSILLANESLEDEPAKIEAGDAAESAGYINKDAQLLVATPFDVLFLLLPLLPSSLISSGKILFQPLDEALEAHTSEDKHLRHVIQHGRQLFEKWLRAFCDTLDAGDENMFRVNEEKTLRSIVHKIERVVQKGLPASMEERFVTRALETPVLSVKREESSVATTNVEPTAGIEEDLSKSESFDSQSTTASSAPSVVFSEVSVASSVTTVATDSASDDLKHLQRLKTVQNFVLASYLPPTLSQTVQMKIKNLGLLPDFSPLDQHLKHRAELRAEVMASRSIGDFSRKRGNADDDEAAEGRAEKKRKLEEEEKSKRVGVSRGVRDLKKVNVTGMKKMSDFFIKKHLAAKAKS